MRCVCDEHSGRCRELVTDDRWGPWCNPCNVARFARIDASFEAIRADLEG